MSNFNGYLLKAVATNTIFPNKYLVYEGWDATPNQREEIKAIRDDNTRDLFRITAQGTKNSLTFTVKSGLHLADKIIIQKFFTDAEVNHLERKIELEYWNDEDNEYKTAYFYRPDIKFTMKKITKDDIIYKEFTIDLVEY